MRLIILTLLIMSMYIIIINILSFIPKTIYYNDSTQYSTQGSSDINLGMSISPSISVVRAGKFYGRVYEDISKGTSNLYLFYFIRFPLKSERFDFRTTHKFFFSVLGAIVFIISVTNLISRRERRFYYGTENEGKAFQTAV